RCCGYGVRRPSWRLAHLLLDWFAAENKARPKWPFGLHLTSRWPKLFVSQGDFMPIDYEAEYNNRALVPEHPEIFARWERESAAYRSALLREDRADLGIAYGPTARQTIDLFHPAGDRSGSLALFIHGGYWRSLAPSQFSHMARGLNTRGVSVAVAGYDLCPQV